MTSASARRIALHEHARDSWGADTAETLMDLLPADPDQFATKTDLAALRSDLRDEIREFRDDLRDQMVLMQSQISDKIDENQRTLMLAMLTMMVGLVVATAGMVATVLLS